MATEGGQTSLSPVLRPLTQPPAPPLTQAEGFVLQAEGWTGGHAVRLGLLERQEEMVQGRPTYKKRGKDEFLFYTASGYWNLGPDMQKDAAHWQVKSAARTPGAITETWTVHDGRGWVEVPAAKIVQAPMSPRRRSFIEERTSK